MLIKRSFLWLVVLLWGNALSAQAINPPACDAEASKPVAYASPASRDTLTVKVSGAPCSQAKVTIRVASESGKTLYSYEGDFIDHMPYLIYEPELNNLVSFYIDKVLATAITRTTSDLPAYTNVEDYYEANNDFVVVPVSEYEAMRAAERPVLWHITGESSWVHSVYDRETAASKEIMRGGVFRLEN